MLLQKDLDTAKQATKIAAVNSIEENSKHLRTATEKDFEYCISKGAKYVLISDSGEEYITEDAKKLYLKTEMINVDGVKFYKL